MSASWRERVEAVALILVTPVILGLVFVWSRDKARLDREARRRLAELGGREKWGDPW
jgi:hypothetical protein